MKKHKNFLIIFLHTLFLGTYITVSYLFITIGERNTKSSDPKIKMVGQLTYRFLTNWTYGIQLLYYICVVFSHILSLISLHKSKDKLRQFSDTLFTTIVIPFGLVVTVSFWSLYIIDRELVFPSFLDKVIPVWINHALHSFNSVLPLLDMMLYYHKFPTWKVTSICIIMYSSAYSICFFGTYFTKGIWIYPMFEKMSPPEIGFYSVTNIFAAFLIHAVARFASKLLWGLPEGKPKTKKNKQKTYKIA